MINLLTKASSCDFFSVDKEYMLDIMYEIPKDDNIGEVVITEGYIQGNGGPKILMRGQEIPALEG